MSFLSHGRTPVMKKGEPKLSLITLYVQNLLLVSCSPAELTSSSVPTAI